MGACSLLLLLLSQFLRPFVPRGVGEADFYARLRSPGKGQKSFSTQTTAEEGERIDDLFYIFVR